MDLMNPEDASRMCEAARQFATIKRLLTEQVVGIIRQDLNQVGTNFTDSELIGVIISEQTVKNHLHNIFDKLGLSETGLNSLCTPCTITWLTRDERTRYINRKLASRK